MRSVLVCSVGLGEVRGVVLAVVPRTFRGSPLLNNNAQSIDPSVG